MNEQTNLSTADFAAAADQREHPTGHEVQAREREDRHATARDIHETRAEGKPAPKADARPATGHEAADEQLAPLFLPQVAQNFRSKWDEVQIGFVDDPTHAVRQADELVAQVMKNLAQTFAEERARVEGQMDQADTEHLRVALRRYRSFFQRLLSL